VEELFNVALVIMCGFINPKIEQSKNEISSPKSNDDILKTKKMIKIMKNHQKQKRQTILKSLTKHGTLFLMN
jgi:hypothetical protein